MIGVVGVRCKRGEHTRKDTDFDNKNLKSGKGAGRDLSFAARRELELPPVRASPQSQLQLTVHRQLQLRVCSVRVVPRN